MHQIPCREVRLCFTMVGIVPPEGDVMAFHLLLTLLK